MTDPIQIETRLSLTPDEAWGYYVGPEHVVHWNFASPDWHCPEAEADLRVGGKFKSRMAARDGSMAFDFEGTYEKVEAGRLLEYRIADGREVQVEFRAEGAGSRVVVRFEAENMNSRELQQAGWQSILDSFGRYASGQPAHSRS